MSELINNREMRQQVIKDIIKQLHEGKTTEEVKQQFADAFEGVSAREITEAESALMQGGLPVEEVQRLCDVHAAVFKGSIAEIHQPQDPSKIPGHPVHTLEQENRYLEKVIEQEIRPNLSKDNKQGLLEGINKLEQIAIHYERKENLFFPYMEKYGITAPPKVMWGVDDEIRAQIKEVKNLILQDKTDDMFISKAEDMLNRVTEMIFKEEKIMAPMLIEQLTQDEWKLIASESRELGFLIDPVPTWSPEGKEPQEPNKKDAVNAEYEGGLIKLPSGEFKLNELVSMLNTLPFDITYVDKNDEVKFFTEGKERTFPRTRAIIGRNVSNCHPPASVHIVEKIVEDFKNNVKDQEDFWIRMKDKLILIRYYAVRDGQGEYLGVLEVTQDIKPIQELTGEKRLMSD